MPSPSHALPAERVSLTERRMRDLVPPERGERLVYDTNVPELAVRLRAGGRPRFYVQRWAGGRQRRIALGAWPSLTVDLARELARARLVDLARGVDPVAGKREAAAKLRGGRVPFADVLKRHLALLEGRGRTGPHVKEVAAVCRLAIAAGITDLAAANIAARAADWLGGLEVSPSTRQRYRRHLIAAGKTAARWWSPAVLPREPFAALSGEDAPLPPPAFFTPQECARLVSDEALAMEATGGRLWAFLLYTGCRRREGTHALPTRMDLDRAVYEVVPPTPEERRRGAAVKRNKSRTIQLQAELVELMRGWPWSVDQYLFEPRHRGGHYVDRFRGHLEALGIPLNGRHVHSLRHSHAILAIAAGEDSLRLRLSMGHAGPEMAAHYASAAMRWRGQLAGWHGVFRLRDKAEAERLEWVKPAASAVG